MLVQSRSELRLVVLSITVALSEYNLNYIILRQKYILLKVRGFREISKLGLEQLLQIRQSGRRRHGVRKMDGPESRRPCDSRDR